LLVHIGEPSLFRSCVLEKINASLIPLLFKPFVKFDIAYSPPSRRHLCPFTREGGARLRIVSPREEEMGRCSMVPVHL
jgi:hypothetical protein